MSKFSCRIACLLFPVLALPAAAAQNDLFSKGTVASGAHLGAAVAVVEDMTGDGTSEMVVGSPDITVSLKSGCGQVQCFAGDAGHALLWSFAGPFAGDHIGSAIANIGDVTGDGKDDVAVGAPSASTAGTPATQFGRVFVLNGATGALLYAINDIQTGSQWGFSVAPAGDVDLTGGLDFLLGAPTFDGGSANTGKAVVVTGHTGVGTLAKFGVNSGDRFGHAVASVGDTNSDGRPDFAVGAPQEGNGGRVRVFSGLSGGVLLTFTGAHTNDQFGTSLAGPGDMDHNGHNDLLVGAPGESSVIGDDGVVHVFDAVSGAATGVVNGGLVGAEAGACIAVAGDVDLDTFTDFIVGMPGWELGTEHGRIVVVSGRNLAVLQSASGPQAGCRFGASASGKAKFDGDGIVDYVIGEPNLDTQVAQITFPNTGAARAISSVAAGTIVSGAGTPGCLGAQTLLANSATSLGNTQLKLHLTKAPNTVSLLMFVDSPLIAPTDYLGIGATLMVDLISAVGVYTYDEIPDTVPGLSRASVPIPNSIVLDGLTVFGQCISVWPAAQCVPSPFGISSSSALTMTLFKP